MDSQEEGVDLSPLHRELDRLKTRLCRCNHTGECVACRGFEILRQQTQMVVAAASQPVLMQVAQEAAVKDMVDRLSGVSEKLTADSRLQELVAEMMQRVQDDLGGADAVQRMFGGMGLGGFPGFGPSGSSDEAAEPDGGSQAPRRDVPYDDLPPDERRPQRPQDPTKG